MTTSIYVDGLSGSTTEADLWQLFASAGEVNQVRLVVDDDTSTSQGFAFVEFADDAAAQRAIAQFNGYRLGDRVLIVHEAGSREDWRRGGFRGSDDYRGRGSQ